MGRVRWVRGLVLLLCATLIVVAVALPNTSLAWLRSEYRWLGQPLNWIEHLWPAVDLVHVLLFAGLGGAARLALPGVGLLKLLGGLVVFSGASELLQFAAPGRVPRWSDFFQDLIGVALGVTGAMLLQGLVRALMGGSKAEVNHAGHSWLRWRVDQVRRRVEERVDQLGALTHRKLLGGHATAVPPFDDQTRFAVVTVNFSTTRWLKLMLLTLCEQQALDRVVDIVIVDNASRDGGRELARTLARQVPRITLVENDRFLSHARGMRLGFAALDRQASNANVLLSVDTDVIFRRPDALTALAQVFDQGAVLAGEMRQGIYEVPEAQASFVAVRRDVYARPEVLPWVNHGAPSYWMQRSIRRAGWPVADFASNLGGFILHRGRSGVNAAFTHHPAHAYASVSDRDPHYMGVPDGEAIWQSVEQRWAHLLEPGQEAALVQHLQAALGRECRTINTHERHEGSSMKGTP